MMRENYVTFVESWRKPVVFDRVSEIAYEGRTGSLVVKSEEERHSFNISEIEDFQFRVSDLAIVIGKLVPTNLKWAQEIEFLRKQMRFTARYEYETKPGTRKNEKLEVPIVEVTAFKGEN